jgi:hypothetical protein
MASTWALLAIGRGMDEGTSWLLATGPRDEMSYRGRLVQKRIADIGVWAGLPWRIGHVAIVPAEHPAIRRARRDLEITSLAIIKGDRVWFLPDGAAVPELGRSIGGTCTCHDRDHHADEGVTMVRIERQLDGEEFFCCVAWQAEFPGDHLGRVTARAA